VLSRALIIAFQVKSPVPFYFFLAVLISINTFRGYKDKSGASKVVFFFQGNLANEIFSLGQIALKATDRASH